MHKLEIEVLKREKTGKEGSKKVRKEGLVPGIIYGKNFEPISIKLNPSDITKALKKFGSNVLVEFKSSELSNVDKKIGIIKELQKHPISRDILHVDFQRINEKEKIEIEVPIKIIGKSEGEKMGGLLEKLLRQLKIKCLPFEIPDAIEINVESLGLGQVLHIKDIEVPEGIELLENPEEGVITIISPHEEVEEEEAEEEESATEEKSE